MSTSEEMLKRGQAVMEKKGVWDVEAGHGGDKEFADLTQEMLYGGIFGRPGMSLRDRELISMAVMVATGADFDRLYNHFRNAHMLGITDREVREMIFQVMFYAGWPKGAAAIRYFNRVKAGEKRK
jgi:4-carboxymuconolactone decarboxylase